MVWPGLSPFRHRCTVSKLYTPAGKTTQVMPPDSPYESLIPCLTCEFEGIFRGKAPVGIGIAGPAEDRMGLNPVARNIDPVSPRFQAAGDRDRVATAVAGGVLQVDEARFAVLVLARIQDQDDLGQQPDCFVSTKA